MGTKVIMRVLDIRDKVAYVDLYCDDSTEYEATINTPVGDLHLRAGKSYDVVITGDGNLPASMTITPRTPRTLTQEEEAEIDKLLQDAFGD